MALGTMVSMVDGTRPTIITDGITGEDQAFHSILVTATHGEILGTHGMTLSTLMPLVAEVSTLGDMTLGDGVEVAGDSETDSTQAGTRGVVTSGVDMAIVFMTLGVVGVVAATPLS